MKVTYRDGTEEIINGVESYECDDNFVNFTDEDDNNIISIAIDLIKKIK